MVQFFKKNLQVSPKVTFIFIPLYSLLLTVVMLLLQPNSVSELMDMALLSYFLMPLLNYLPIFLILTLLVFLLGRLSLGAGVGTFLFILMSLANRYKIILRDDPLFLWDIPLVRELLGIAGGFGAGLILLCAVGIVAALALIIIISIKIRGPRLKWYVRIMGAAGALAIMILLNSTLYRSGDVHVFLSLVGSPFRQTDQCNSKGFLYYFIYTANTNSLDKPEGYNTDEIEVAIQEYSSDGLPSDAVMPNIIMVMDESYSGLSESIYLDFSNYTDPMANYKELSKDSLSGEIIVPNVGGGTVNTEFDVLTGLATRNLRGISDSYRMINQSTEGLTSLLSGLGYSNVAMHPGDAWFYNRQNVYQWLGFEEIMFQDQFPQEFRGSYISQTATIDNLIAAVSDHTASKKSPLFALCVTIQNHGAYQNKYGEVTQNFDTELSLTEEDLNNLSNYFTGVIDADTELLRLTEYLDTLEEPTVLVYFGDHLPPIGSDLYDMLLPVEGESDSLSALSAHTRTPYLIWQNSAAEDTNILDRAEALSLPATRDMSSNYLGGYLLQILGLDSASPYFTYLNEMRSKYPYLFESIVYSTSAEAADPDRMSLLRQWMYYQLYG